MTDADRVSRDDGELSDDIEFAAQAIWARVLEKRSWPWNDDSDTAERMREHYRVIARAALAPTLAARDAAESQLAVARQENEKLRDVAQPVLYCLAGSYKCPMCGNNGMGHASETCPSLLFQTAFAALGDQP